MRRDKNPMKIVVIVLSVVLLLALAYIGYNFYAEWSYGKQVEAYQQGVQVGLESAITQVAQQAATCQQVPLNIQNQTITLIAVECLQQAQQQAQQAEE